MDDDTVAEAGPVGSGPGWFDELTPKPGPPWLSMGVHPLDLAAWLIVDDRYGEELALKRRLLDERHSEVFAARAAGAAACEEVLELVVAWLAEHQPTLIAPDQGAGGSALHATGGDVERMHPLDRAGRLVQEDLCVLQAAEGAYRLEAASLCFPSHWRLADKLGRSLAAIHAPVPHYGDELETKVDLFFDRLHADRPVWRRNLSIHSHDDLFAPGPHEAPDCFAPDASGVNAVWLRSERQTLRRLPRTGAVLFTIKTQQCPLPTLAARPDLARALASRLRSEQIEHRHTGAALAFPPWLIDWLEGVPQRR